MALRRFLNAAEQESRALLPLPNHDYDCSEIAIVVGREEGFVVFQTNKYSIAPEKATPEKPRNNKAARQKRQQSEAK